MEKSCVESDKSYTTFAESWSPYNNFLKLAYSTSRIKELADSGATLNLRISCISVEEHPSW